jgi:HD-GYP domain-containing protein (c-di-GMP phosphodiesterase class II)
LSSQDSSERQTGNPRRGDGDPSFEGSGAPATRVKRVVARADDRSMEASERVESTGGGVLAAALDEGGVGRVETTRSARSGGLRAREAVAVCVLGGGFLAVAIAAAVLAGAGDAGDLALLVTLVGCYATVSRIEFEIFTGSAVPTQLVLVPMLVLLPVGWVPLAVAAGLVCGSLVDASVGRLRSLALLVSSWHAVGPVLVLALLAPEPSWSSWPVFALALAAQFAFDGASVTFWERITSGVSPLLVLPYLARAWAVDCALAPVGLAFAFSAVDQPYAVLLVLPLAGLMSVFARERRARIDGTLELSAAYRGTALLLGDVVEADDAYTGLHSRDVVSLAVAVADRLGLDGDERRDTELAALLHDVGKIRIPSEIINKPGPLTPEERAVMETHTIEGQVLLERVGGLLGRVGVIVRSCHERWDGAGYPDGLAADDIPVVARIVMCCDAFSAMTTTRSYRAALPVDEALAELHRNAGSQFDPAVVDALVAVVAGGAATRPLAA